MSNTIEWFAYLQTNGSIQLKRFHNQIDIEEALESAFVADVFGPFDAESRNIATVIASEHFDSMLYELNAYEEEEE